MDFFKGFWLYLAQLSWWQSAIIIAMVVFIYVVGKFWTKVLTWIGTKLFPDSSDVIQYRMFWGLSNDAINIQIKNEIRRSFKENGFDILSGNDFVQYVKNQSKTMMSILRNHIINLYPTSKKLKIPMDDLLEFIRKKESEIEDIFFEIYSEAKKIKKNDEDKLKEIDEKFEKEIEKFINNKNNNDCNDCLLILHGKGEIVKNKKSNIKTLKSQMNFSEQKLSKIHSDFLTYYSEKIKLGE
jgi:hypothetical protein